MTAPLILKCAECSRVRHDRCLGRGAGCRCILCHRDEMLALARARYERSADTGTLRASLGDLLALAVQRETRRRKIASAAPVPQGVCGCGCGEIAYGSPYGRRRVYRNRAHAFRAYRARRRERGQAAA